MRAPGILKRAFTLIELLVVVAIITLLVSILMPSLAKAKQMAKDVQCGAQLRNIGLGWQMYLTDSNETFPLWFNNMQWFYGGKEPAVATIPSVPYRPLNPYIGLALRSQPVAEVFCCPVQREIPSVTDGYSAYDYFGNSYMMTFMLLFRYDPTAANSGMDRPNHVGDIKIDAARMVLAGDCQWYYAINDVHWDANFHNRQDKMNIVYLDGHETFTQIIRGCAQTAEYSFYTIEDPGP